MGLCIGLGFLFYSQSRLLGEVQSSSNEEPHQISVLAPTAGRVFVWSTASASCVEALPDRGVTSVSKNACKCFISLLSVLSSHQGYAANGPLLPESTCAVIAGPIFAGILTPAWSRLIGVLTVFGRSLIFFGHAWVLVARPSFWAFSRR